MSWDSLKAIKAEAKQIREEDLRKPLLECPIDGEPLQFRNGIYNCPWGNYTTTRTTSES